MKQLELHPTNITKSNTIKIILNDLIIDFKECDFMLCIGDGRNDENIFQVLEDIFPKVESVTIGKKQTRAKWYVDENSEIIELLNVL